MSEHLTPVPKIPRTIWVLTAAAFIIALGYGFIAPILPQFTASFGVSMVAAGAVVSVFAAARLIGAPGAGILVDKVGSRPVYITGLLIVAVATFLVAFAQAYWHVFALRFIAGFGSTMFTLSAQALIVRVAPPMIRGRASAVYASAFLLGNIIGPVIGALLASLGFRIPFAVYGIGVGAAAIMVWILTSTPRGRVVLPPKLPPMRLSEAISLPTYQSLLTSGFANGWANFGARVSVLPLFAASVFANGSAAAGLALTAFALGTAVTLQFSGRLADAVGRKPLIIAGLAATTVFTGSLGLATHVWSLLLLSVLAGVGGGLMNPAQQATLADLIGNERSGGKALSTFQMTMDAGQICAPIVVGMLAEVYGFGVAFASCGALTLASLIVWLLRGQETRKELA
ncbi:MFS transporter [Corynebacterium sanguinis]|uniref:Transporter, major facilitator family protein n=3 Tax=Corynebacterium TaxID=1716 RepID=C0XQK1_CORLD|nr:MULTISPECIES: MFS transporter [Corynebacterium]EEI17415.1 transporter, major facilitator family protein [Corynebacterium lipophiloflavum DSM 44291]MCT1414014.1 MFS transporter [Corynebacterium sanguinis]MCT1492081.1 MFS transporter [Corynebacterium sanguinis]MCT1883369.1 MFS transporter [Corynebacterium sanguinis]MCT2247571.1 MFS transporter [Corynebacterium sanguinis]